MNGMFVTDLDGTLRRDSTVGAEDISALEHLGELGIPRVIATGRSPYSFRKLAGDGGFPVDYLVLSSGAAIIECGSGECLRSESMPASLTAYGISKLTELELDFTVHQTLPDNHVFRYAMHSGENRDMERRIDLYRDFCEPLDCGGHEGAATQLVVIVPSRRSAGVLEQVTEALGDGFSIVRTTSPLDGDSLWIEVFSENVNKSSGTDWLASRLGLESIQCAAVGNDYNDQDLLEWVGEAFVLDSAPEHLRVRYRSVDSVGEAVTLWLGSRSSSNKPGGTP